MWVGQFRGGDGHSNRVVGVSTASGANSDVQISSASPMPLTVLAVDAQDNGGNQIIVSDGRSARLYTFAACRLQAVVDRAGAPFVFDLQNLRDHGTGVGCSDLGNGTVATIGPSDTVTATSAQDPAVTSAQTISCGDLTIGQDGVQQP